MCAGCCEAGSAPQSAPCVHGLPGRCGALLGCKNRSATKLVSVQVFAHLLVMDNFQLALLYVLFSLSVTCWASILAGTCTQQWTGHQEGIQDIAVSMDGNSVITGSDDNTARVFTIG